MVEIKKIKEITKTYGDWKPSDVAFIKRLELSKGNLTLLVLSQSRGNIAEWPNVKMKFLEVSITFLNIQNLELVKFDSKLHQITGFDIIDVSDKGLERIAFQIVDYEESSINFYCESIEINYAIQPEYMSL